MRTILLLFLIVLSVPAQVTQQWVKRYNGSDNKSDYAKKVLVDRSSGSVFVTGYSFNSSGNYYIVTIKYNSAGIQQWVKTYNGIPNGNDDPGDMTLDNLGNLIITGTSTGLGSGNDCITIKYDYNGNLKWVKRYNGTGNGDDAGLAITSDTQGGIVITGRSRGIFSGTNTSDDIITIKYDYFGNQEWM
ncbi:MAG: hypothetical protein JNK43_00485, partial [Ignavibacteria bacterium]|nr:hypothetical protein [Ignavibacteria bacterium]